MIVSELTQSQQSRLETNVLYLKSVQQNLMNLERESSDERMGKAAVLIQRAIEVVDTSSQTL